MYWENSSSVNNRDIQLNKYDRKYDEDQLTVYKEVLLYSELDDTNCQLVFVTTLLNTKEDALLDNSLISSSLVQYKHDILLVSDWYQLREASVGAPKIDKKTWTWMDWCKMA